MNEMEEAAARIGSQLSGEAAALLRAAIVIGRALARWAADAARDAARVSAEHARALREATEAHRRLAAPVYRAALREGWWEDPRVSAEERARAVGLANRFAPIDADARAVAQEARRRVEAQQEARRAADTARSTAHREREEAKRAKPRDRAVEAIGAVDVSALAAVAPLVVADQDKAGETVEEILRSLRTGPADAPTGSLGAPVAPAPAAPVRARAPRGVMDEAMRPWAGSLRSHGIDDIRAAVDAGTEANTATRWDTLEARGEWARALGARGIDAEAVRAAHTASLGQSVPRSRLLAVPAARAPGTRGRAHRPARGAQLGV